MNKIIAKVLLIDDTPINLELLEELFLDISGVETLTADSGKAGLEILSEHEVAVILLDVSMPGIDGFKTAQLIRNYPDTEHVPIIFLTAYGDVDLMKGYALGGVDYITKPFNIRILISKVQVFVDLFRLKESMRIQQLKSLQHEKERAVAYETAQLNEELTQTNQRLRDLSNRYIELQEDERKRLARQVHDELGQQLVATKMKLSIGDYDSVVVMDMLDDLIHTTRQLSKSLRPAQLDHLGLVAAINDHLHQFSNQYDLDYNFVSDIDDDALDSTVASSLFRIYQEGIHNILKHSQARYVNVSLVKNDELIEFSIKDNGIGLTSLDQQKDGCFGLLGIQERLYPLNGNFEMKSDNGTELIVTVPV